MGTAGPAAWQEQPQPRGRPLVGFLACITLAAIVAYPVLMTGLMALFNFAGCVTAPCGEPRPQPMAGVLFAAATTVLVTIPFAVGIAVAGFGWRVTTTVAVVTAAIVATFITLIVLQM
ncbi:MAG: hypothetical protein GEU97_08185 [Actinophytocola sp.]|nr:hypothetical protein [Actinophytocola sp.]